MKTAEITLYDGWNPRFKAGTKVVATRPFYTANVGDVFEYAGCADHPDYGWAIFLKDCDLVIPAYYFETRFEQVLEATTVMEFIDIKNREHLEAISVMFKTGVWPDEFYKTNLAELEFENGWQYMLSNRMAMAFIDDRLQTTQTTER